MAHHGLRVFHVLVSVSVVCRMFRGMDTAPVYPVYLSRIWLKLVRGWWITTAPVFAKHFLISRPARGRNWKPIQTESAYLSKDTLQRLRRFGSFPYIPRTRWSCSRSSICLVIGRVLRNVSDRRRRKADIGDDVADRQRSATDGGWIVRDHRGSWFSSIVPTRGLVQCNDTRRAALYGRLAMRWSVIGVRRTGGLRRCDLVRHGSSRRPKHDVDDRKRMIDT